METRKRPAKKLFTVLLLIFLLSPASISYGSDPCMIKIDINIETNNNDANTQAGFKMFTIDANNGGEVNGVTINIGGNIQSTRRNDPSGIWFEGTYYPRAGERLYRDFIHGVSPSGVTVTLWGLGVNRDCNITIWAYDACSPEDFNRVANWYSNGTYIFETNFTGGPVSWPRYEGAPGGAADLYKYAWSKIVTSDNFGRIILTSSKDPCSPAGEDFAFVNALMVEPEGTYIPTTYAYLPVPFDGTDCAPVNTLLKWRNGAGVVSHDLYLGSDFSDVNDATRASHPGVLICEQDLAVNAGEGYDPLGAVGFLELNKTYYWRVDENSPPTVYKGEVWNFTTCPNSVVDNFDEYRPPATAMDLQAVWQAYDCAIVLPAQEPNRGGGTSWSMEYEFYNYSYSPYISEARADVDTARPNGLEIDSDWLGMGAKALVLWFYGQAGNDANQPMYVKLVDGSNVTGKVNYYGDMNDIREPEWHEWNIDLQDFVDNNNVDLSDVNKIIIGFGDGTPASSDGTVYFEDIQLYVTRCSLIMRSADFAKVDYAPLDVDNHPGGDCKVDYQELAVMILYWLDVWDPEWTPPSDYVAYWPMNEGDGNRIYTDPCDPNFTGIFSPSGVTWATPGQPDRGGAHALCFDGSLGTGISCGSADLGIGPTPPDVNAMTLSIWVKWSGPRNDPYLDTFPQGMISKANAWGEPNMMFRFEVINYDYWDLGRSSSFGLWHYTTDSSDVPNLFAPLGILAPFIGHWIHLAATYPHPSGNPADANSYAKLYLNGVEVASGPWRFSHGDPCTTYLTIGNNWDEAVWPGGSPESFNGYLDEPRIYKSALTAEQIAYMAGREPPCDLYSEPCPLGGCPKLINFEDYAVLMSYWLQEELWP